MGTYMGTCRLLFQWKSECHFCGGGGVWAKMLSPSDTSLVTEWSFMWLWETCTEIKPAFFKPLVQGIFWLLQMLVQGTQQENSWKKMHLLDN